MSVWQFRTPTVPMPTGIVRSHIHRRRKNSSWKLKCCRNEIVVEERLTQSPNFWQICSLHGIQELYAAETIPLRIFWLVAFSLALFAAVYGCYAILHEYLESPVVISYFVQEPKTNSIPLPDVIVCPFNRFNSSFLAENNVSQELADFIQITYGFGVPYHFKRSVEISLMNQSARYRHDFASLLGRLQLSFTEFTQAASLSCGAVVSHCVISGQIVDCCQSAEPLMTAAGKCYRLAGIDQLGAGFGFGITVVINLHSHLFTPAYNNLHNDGVAIKLAERGKGADFDLSFLPKSSHVLMSLRATKYDFMSDPPRYECMSNPQDLLNYSRESCVSNCLFAQPEKILCSTPEFLDCLVPAATKEFGANGDLLSRCQQGCKPTCTYWQYSSTLSYTHFPSKSLGTYVSEKDLDSYRDQIILDVFYEKLEFTMIKHFPRMTVDTFVSNLGGQIGLWVGGSILTLTQLAVFGASRLRSLISRLHTHRHSRSATKVRRDQNSMAIATLQ